MSHICLELKLCLAVSLLASGAMAWGQGVRDLEPNREAKLTAVLKSSKTSLKDKADACLELARVGTRNSVAPLAALLGDETIAHMARYALEPIPDPAVDEALRAALGKLKGRPLVGAIGSIGLRRDAKSVGPLTRLLKDKNADVSQAAARALGSIGNPGAVEALEHALPGASAADQAAIAEGLFRCAESLLAKGKRSEALAIYDQVNQHPQMPKSLRDGAARKARLLRQEDGPRL
jgi:HEAT repeat protein